MKASHFGQTGTEFAERLPNRERVFLDMFFGLRTL
jgi:hypothetical protein